MIDPSEIVKHHDEILFNCGRKETASFEKDNFMYVDTLISGNSRRWLMRWICRTLVCRGKVTAIENITQEEKEDLWQFVKETCAGKTDDIVKLKEICMVFVALDYFIKENKH